MDAAQTGQTRTRNAHIRQGDDLGSFIRAHLDSAIVHDAPPAAPRTLSQTSHDAALMRAMVGATVCIHADQLKPLDQSKAVLKQLL